MDVEGSASILERRHTWLGTSARQVTMTALASGALVLGAGTVMGLAAPLYPYLDIINHFRLALLLAAGGLLIATWLVRSRRLAVPVGIIASANLLLVAAPLAYLPQSASQGSLRIATFNVWVGNRDPQSVIDFIKESEADIVVLQEVNARLEVQLVPALQQIYPWVTSCARRNCGLVLLSKLRPSETGYSDRKRHQPPLVWASFVAGSGKAYTITGLHLAFPFQPDWQVAQTKFLAQRFSNAAGAQILVGDFNLTPFSWKLNQLTAETELRRHATFGATWPSHRLTPLVLLDNLLATADVKSVAASYGQNGYGSDHRPMIFDIAFD